VVTRTGLQDAIGGTRTIRNRVGVATHLQRSRKVEIWDIMAVTVKGEGVSGGNGGEGLPRGRSEAGYRFTTASRLAPPRAEDQPFPDP